MPSMDSNFNERQFNGTGDFNSNAHDRQPSSGDENQNQQNRSFNQESKQTLSM